MRAFKTYKIHGITYRENPAGGYALYLKAKDVWRESSCITNKMLEDLENGIV